ncbi:MAG: PAS domain S-box protein [Halopseudomonas sp.]
MKQWRLSQALSLQVALIVAFPLLVLALISYFWVFPQVHADVKTGHQDIAQAMAEKIQIYLAGADHELSAIALYMEGRLPRSAPTWQPMLNAHLSDDDLFESISLIDNRGITRAIGLPPQRRAERETYLGVDISRKPFYIRAKKLQAKVWSNTFLSVITGRLAVALAIPIDDNFMLVAELSLGQLTDDSRQGLSSSHLITMLIDRNAQLIAHPDPSLAGQQFSLRNLDIVMDGLKNGGSTQEFEYQHTDYIGTSVLVPKLEWLVLVAQEKSYAYRYVTFALEATLAVSIIALLVATISGIYLASGLSRRIHQYSENARQIAKGEYALHWPRIRISEFSVLASHLQKMAQSIQQREQALSNSEASLLATMEQTPNVAIQWFDAQGKVLYWNHASTQLYQLSSDQALGKKIDQLIYTTQQADEFQTVINRVSTTGLAVGPIECTTTGADGKERITLNTTFMIPSPDNSSRFVSMAIDITEQKIAERALRLREQRYRALIEQSPIAVIEWDLNFNVTEWNEAAEEIFGYPRSEALGQHATFIVPSELHEMVDGVMATLAANIGGFRSENTNVTASNRLVTCQWYNQPIVDEQGKVVAIVSSIDDVSERKRMELKLRTSEQKFISLFQSSPVPMAVSYFSETPRFVNCNDAWLRLFGVSRNDVIGYNSDDLNIWPHKAQMLQAFQLLDKQGLVDDYHADMQQADGTRLQCLISARFIEVGEERMVASAYKDITQQLKAENEILELNQSLESRVLERTSELAHTNAELETALAHLEQTQDDLIRSEKLAALGSLVAGVAHELNTPIGNSLMAATTLTQHSSSLERAIHDGTLKRSSLEQYIKDARAGCTIVETNLHKASELVTSFKQVAIDQTSSQRRQFQLLEVINEIAITIAPSLKKTPFELNKQIPEEIFLDSYPGPLGQVLTNLINNAILHGLEGKEKGLINIEAAQSQNKQIQLIVSDDGKGIANADLTKIFDPFYTSKLGQGGSGLGLNIVHNLVTQVLGGKIEVNSAPGKGTQMMLTLPVSAPEPKPDSL